MEQQADFSTTKKALQVNLDDSIYGTFAEIGAGQEVARHFFQAGRASHTIAKSISAYDMTFSDAIYGKDKRYVCESRLLKMLDHETSLLTERLGPKRGATSRFFAFANTVATQGAEDESTKSHGWMGIRFQAVPNGPMNDIVLHVRLWDRFRLQQQEALGVLGVNLIHMAFFPPEDPKKRISMLLENLNNQRIEVNMVRFTGDNHQHLDDRLMSLELVKQGLTDAVMFGPKGEVQHVFDELYGKPVIVQRGTYRPVTNVNVEIMKLGQQQMKVDSPISLFEITMSNLMATGEVDGQDFLDRVDVLSTLGQRVLISNFDLFYQLKFFLRQATQEPIAVVLGASHLEKLFDERYYAKLKGGILEGFSRLFDHNTKLLVYPFKTDTECRTAGTFHPMAKLEHLYQYFRKNEQIIDMTNCDNVNTSLHSQNVRTLLQAGDSKWEELVPKAARDLIKKRRLFGVR